MAMFYRPVKMPTALANQTNGDLDPSMLRAVSGGSLLFVTAATAFEALRSAFLRETGRGLTYTGCYRSYVQQRNLFIGRYEKVSYATYLLLPKERRKVWKAIPQASPHHADNPSTTYWSLKKGPNGNYYAMAASPGTSNHGWGLAVDLAVGASPSQAVRLGAADSAWLEANLERFGFSYEVPSEPWHVHYFAGDAGVDVSVPSGGQRLVLRMGSVGEAVRMLQARLNIVSGETLKVDGLFGSMTDAAVRRFQRASGIVVDGIVGPVTWAKLYPAV